jgi:hypothetical protein
MIEDFLINNLKTPLVYDSNYVLHLHDKILLRKSTTQIIFELNSLMDILESDEPIKIVKRKSFVICINLAQNLGFTDSRDAKTLTKSLKPFIKDGKYNGKRENLSEIKLYLVFLLDFFRKVDSGLFGNKLDYTLFDCVIDINTGNIVTNAWNALRDAGVWEASADLAKGKIIAYGKLPPDKFLELTKKAIPGVAIEYYQKIPMERVSRDD